MDKVDYWLELAADDLAAIHWLMKGKKHLQAAFFCHLTVEKALKAIIANVASEFPPRTHDLTKLAVRGGVFDELSEEQLSLLEELNPLNIDGRYPEYKTNISQMLTTETINRILKETEDFLCWTKKKLGR